jgi:hypothetical protein
MKNGAIVVTGVGSTDPLPLLLRDPALVLAAEPCLLHRRRLELRIAALKCLGRADFLRFGAPARRERLYGRIRWALPAESARWWDSGISTSHPAWPFEPDPGEFDDLKVRANRLSVLDRGLDDALAGLPDAFADALVLEPACGSDEGLLRLQARRVAKPGARIVAPWTDREAVPRFHEPLFIWSS